MLSRPPAAQAATAFADDVLSESARNVALQRYRELPSGRERPGRYWRIDLDALSIDDLHLDPSAGSVDIVCDDARVRVDAVPRGFGYTSASTSKFGALAAAFANRYAFVTVPADTDVASPIVVTYRAAEGEALFPYTCIHLERGARATIVESVDAGDGAFVCGISEIVTEEASHAVVAAHQEASASARVLWTRASLPGKDASLALCTADLGGALVVGEIDVALCAPGADVRITSLFFPTGGQHVDLRSTVDHRAGGATSSTSVKSAATGRGQARYVGNIRIAARAQKSDASLRDDALLLSRSAHIDSVPALEIAANDVKAYHGATVGALDAETLFYMMTRGIERSDAERMVTIGFFEPAIERFPATLHDMLRGAVERKVS